MLHSRTGTILGTSNADGTLGTSTFGVREPEPVACKEILVTS